MDKKEVIGWLKSMKSYLPSCPKKIFVFGGKYELYEPRSTKEFEYIDYLLSLVQREPSLTLGEIVDCIYEVYLDEDKYVLKLRKLIEQKLKEKDKGE